MDPDPDPDPGRLKAPKSNEVWRLLYSVFTYMFIITKY